MDSSEKLKKFLVENNLINPSPNRVQKIFDCLARVLPSFFILLAKALTSRNNYKRLTESHEFLLRANKSLGKAEYRQCKKFLKVAISLVGRELPREFRRYVFLEFLRIIRDPKKHLVVSIDLINKIRNLKSQGSKISPDTWYFLSKYLNFLGFTVAGFHARDTSIALRQRRIVDGFSESRSIELAVASCLELNDILQAEKILRLHAQKIRPDRIRDFYLHLSLVSSAQDKKSLQNFYPLNPNLYDLINEKSVALIGPGVPSGEYGYEIDSADVVVRVKFAGSNYLPPANMHGSRCDVASFNNLSSFSLLSDGGVEVGILKGLKAVLSCKRSTLKSIQGVPVVFIDGLRSAYPSGGLTAGITTLVNLVMLNPSRLKVYGFDFYTETRVYNSSLTTFYQNDSWMIGWPPFGGDDLNSFANRVKGHFWEDQICNFALAQNLYNSGTFEIDDHGSGILALSREEYSKRIEELLRNALIKSQPLI